MRKGFTLLEMIVAVAVFTVVVVIILSVLLATIDANRKSHSTQIAVSNLNSSMERMVRELREGNSYDCVVGTPELDDCAGGGSEITFLNVDGLRVVYRLAGNTIERSEDGGGTFTTITGADAVVENLMFFVHGNASVNRQPKALVVVKGYSEEGTAKTRADFSLQTTVSARPDPAIFLEDSGSGEGEAGGPVSGGPTSGLVAHWPFDGNLDDIAGGNNGTFIGGTPNYVAGKVGSFALDFDNSIADMKVLVNNSSSLDTDNFGGLTVAAWINPRTMGDSGDGRIVAKVDAATASHDGWEFRLDNAPTEGRLHFRGEFSTGDVERQSAANTVSLNTWQHVAVTWDRTTDFTGVHIYIDGVEVAYSTGSNGSGTFQDTQDLAIGNLNGGTDRAFDGPIDDVRIYDRVLNQFEIQELYDLGADPPPSNLIGWWKLNEGQGLTAFDSATADGFDDGDITGASWVTDGGSTGQEGDHALEFDANNSTYVDMGDSASFQNLTSVTISAWIYPTADGGVDDSAVAVKSRTTSGGGYELRYSASNKAQFRVSTDLGGASLVASAVSNPNDWYHFAGTWDGSTMKLYVNGVLDNQTARSGNETNDTPGVFSVGAFPGGASTRAFTGIIDDVRIYNEALEQATIQNIYNDGLPGADSESPTAPTDLSATAVSSSQIDLTWTASTDNVGVDHYEVWRCTPGGCTSFNLIDDTVTGTSFSDTGLSAETTYNYVVRAVDAAGNLSPFSTNTEATTLGAPPVRSLGNANGELSPATLPSGTTDVTLGLSTDENATCRHSTVAGTAYSSMTNTFSTTGDLSHSTTVSGHQDGESYTYYVRCQDDAGNENTTDDSADGTIPISFSVDSSDLVSHWKLDETTAGPVEDSAGSNDGTNNDATINQTGRLGKAYSFDGSNDYINVPFLSLFNDISNNPFTVSFWANTASIPGQSTYVRLMEATADSSWKWEFSGAGSDNIIQFRMKVNGTDVRKQAPMPLGQWVHLTGVWDTINLRFYVNAAEVTTDGVGGVSPAAAGQFNIGRRTDGAAATHYGGLIDDVRVYNRALSASEIKALCDAGGCGLIGHWKFDEGSGTTAGDSSGNGNSGTLTNMDSATDWVAGKVGSFALDFDGADDAVNTGSAAPLDNLGPISISAWINPNSLGESGIGNIVAKTSSSGIGVGKWQFRLISDNAIQYRRNDNDPDMIRTSINGTISLGGWQHVVLTWDGTTSAANAHIYKNGSEVSYQPSQNSGTVGSDATADLTIGNRGESDATFDGLIDDVRVYDRVLPASEIYDLCNAGDAVICP